MRKKAQVKSKNLPKPMKSKDMPATRQALEDVRGELKSDITGVRLEVSSLRTEVGSLRNELHHEVGSLRSEVGSLRSELGSVRNEMHHEIGTLRTEMNREIGSLRSEMHHEIGSLRSEMHHEIGSLRSEMNSKFLLMDSRFEEIKSTNHRMLALLEEQNARNRAALDGYAAVHEAQVRIEDRVDKIEKNQFDLAKYLKSKEV